MRKLVYLISTILILTLSAAAQIQLRTTSVNLNFRTSPFLGENIICVIPIGATLYVDYLNQTYIKWIKIDYEGKSGYVYAKYIKDPELKNNYNSASYKFINSGPVIKYYTNSKGEKVQSPTYYNTAPAGATAQCRDGTYSFSRSNRGTCSHHGGVRRWLK
jgi:uncharacterized protein YraI